MKGHPVFIAQHGTATCCRGCLAKWHGIEQGHVLAVLRRWLEAQKIAGPAEAGLLWGP